MLTNYDLNRLNKEPKKEQTMTEKVKDAECLKFKIKQNDHCLLHFEPKSHEVHMTFEYLISLSDKLEDGKQLVINSNWPLVITKKI